MEFLVDTLVISSTDKTKRFTLNPQTISRVEYRDNDDTVVIHSLGEIIIGRALEDKNTLEVYPSASCKEPRLKMEISEDDDMRLMEYLKKNGFGPRKN
jgi:predicted membrane GTPase involved in stress response